MLSIFTPTHDPKYLKEVYKSIKDQPFDEWMVLANGKEGEKVRKKCENLLGDDDRVHVLLYEDTNGKIGDIKAEAVKECSGNILVELDHDDLLAPGAVEKIKKAFEDPDIGFVYSDFAEFDANGDARSPYSANSGWETYKTTTDAIKGESTEYNAMRAFPPHPQSLSKIWYAPNHVRAFRRSAYKEAGGYNQDLKVLDDQDLICRLYQVTDFYHIPECLYFYRVDGNNSYLRFNEEIQKGTWKKHDEYIYQLAESWADKKKLRKIEIGGRFNARPGFESVDVEEGESVDIIANLDQPWDFAEDNSVGVIIAHDLLEHLEDKLHPIKEIYRVLAHGGILLSMTPSTDGRGAFQDPTHKSFYNQNSFLYYTNEHLARFIDTPVRFQEMRLYTGYLGDWQRGNNISHVFAHLMAIKGEENYGGKWEI